MTRARVVTIALAGAVAILAIGLVSTVQVTGDSTKRKADRTLRNGSEVIVGSDAIRETSPLPPPNTPLAVAFEPLLGAARNGNGAAACRLAMEILRCRQHVSDREGLEQMKRTPAQLLAKLELSKVFIAALGEIRTRVSKDAVVCADAPVDKQEAWRLLLEAASRGHVPSMARFASGSAIRDAKGRGEWDLDAAGAYREYAFAFLLRAAQEGDAASIERLGTEHMMRGFGTRAIPFDPPQGLAYLKALSVRVSPDYRKHLEATTEKLISQARMDSADIALAQTMAATILAPAALARIDGATRPAFTPENDFGCR